MPKRSLFSSLGISSKKFLIVFVLLFNSFIWFFMNLFILNTALKNANANTVLVSWTIYLIAIVGSSLLGALVSPRPNRHALIYAWLLLGVITSLLLSALAINVSFDYLLIIIFFSGIAFGLGMPLTLAYFAEYTTFENRGQIGGIIFFATNLGIAAAALFLGTRLAIDSYAAAIWRTIGLAIIFLLKPIEESRGQRKTVPFKSILSNRAFVLFLVPWFMFCLIDRFEYQIFLNSPKLGANLGAWSLLVEPIVGTVFALVGGLLADWVGRKKVVVSGFVALGLAYAVLGVATGTLFAQYFYIVIDGIAWGIFLVLFVLILWGDLASTIGGQEKYYAVGSIPFFIAYLTQYLVKPYLASIPVGTFEVSFSFASLFLFVAILPLIYAPETLPEKKIQERQIRKYVEEAKKVVSKGE